MHADKAARPATAEHCFGWSVAWLHVVCGTSQGCIWYRRSCMHVASARVACGIDARCIVESASHRLRRSAPPCDALDGVRRVSDARSGEGRASRWPSGGMMRWCAELRRRAFHGQRHRAVRHRGDIRHRSMGACGAGRRCESGRCARGRVSADCEGAAASAVRRTPTAAAVAAWLIWSMGPSRSRAARSRTPRRCMRQPVAISRRALHVPNARALRCMLRTMVHMPRGAHATWCRRHVVCGCEPLQVGIRNVLHVAR